MNLFSEIARASLLTALLLGSMVLPPSSLPAVAREQWQVNHPAGAAPTGPVMPGGSVASIPGAASGSAPMGMVTKYHPDFWKGQLQNRVPIGTVLTGILETDISSDESQKGDVFHITIQDGFVLNGKELIPPHSRIIGHIIDAVPSSNLRHGQPGRLQVSLQALVFPDGRTMPFHGFLDQNPNHKPKDEPTQRSHGQNMADYGKSVSSFLGSFTAGIGSIHAKRHRGNDFELDAGEVLPIRLTRTLDLPEIGPNAALPGQAPGLSSVAPMATAPGSFVPGLAAGTAQQPFNQAGGSAARQLVPGLVGPDPDAPPARPGQWQRPMPQGGVPGLVGDPNAIFSQPIQSRPLSSMPDPF